MIPQATFFSETPYSQLYYRKLKALQCPQGLGQGNELHKGTKFSSPLSSAIFSNNSNIYLPSFITSL